MIVVTDCASRNPLNFAKIADCCSSDNWEKPYVTKTRHEFSLLGLLLVGQCYAAGPFGFEKGMTQEQVIKLVGRAAVKEIKNVDGSPDIVIVELNTAPKAHPSFESYRLFITPEKGIVKIVALGTDINTNSFGAEVHNQFIETRDAIARIYGSGETLDSLISGSIWSEPRDRMMGLLKKERILSGFWNLKSAPVNHITVIGARRLWPFLRKRLP